MTEQERLLIVDKINVEKNILKQLYRDKEMLEQNGIVKDIKKVFELDKKIKSSNLSDVINLEFSRVLNEEVRKQNFSCCSHDIWMYYGSHGMLFNNFSCDPCFVEVKNEWDDNFFFNKYICLECCEVIKSSDWRCFEKENIVLKNEGDSFCICQSKFSKYQQLYYELLYNYSIIDANDMIIKEFYKGRRYSKKKIKK